VNGSPPAEADLPRRTFLAAMSRAALLGSTAACARRPRAAFPPSQPGGSRRSLRVLLAAHPVPGYDRWFDEELAKPWSDRHGVSVTVDRVALSSLQGTAAAEVAAQQGHDIVGFLSPPSLFEPHLIDHRGIVAETEAMYGPMSDVARRSTFNPTTDRFFAFSDSWAPAVALWRRDLWEPTGMTPDRWDDVRQAAPILKGTGHPIGIGLSQDLDSNTALLSLMATFGSSVQDQDARVVIDSTETVEAVRFGAELFRLGMTEEVLGWDAISNNRFLEAGRGSLILNPLSVLHSTERNRPELLPSLAVGPTPAGPHGRKGVTGAVSTFGIWRFAENREAAERFLVHLATRAQDSAIHSRFVNLPSFPRSAPDVELLIKQDPALGQAGAPAVLTAAHEWSIHLGYPGPANPAVSDVFNRSLVPAMFAQAALGRARPAEAVADAGRRIEDIYRTWRKRR
jgi:multiple sugar transport system substrate-binding protein